MGRTDVPGAKLNSVHARVVAASFGAPSEKGVDTALVTDLIQAAVVDDLLDIAVLVSADADFVPAVELIQNRTDTRVIHAHFRPQGQQLRNACWSHIFLDDLMPELLPPRTTS